MAINNVTAVLLPGVSFFLKENYANARKMIDSGVRVALATDFNPGSSMTTNLLLMTTLGCNYLGMTVEETLQAITIHAARVLQKQDIGMIQKDFKADLVFLDVPHYAGIPYYFGVNPVKKVMKKGTLVYER